MILNISFLLHIEASAIQQVAELLHCPKAPITCSSSFIIVNEENKTYGYFRTSIMFILYWVVSSLSLSSYSPSLFTRLSLLFLPLFSPPLLYYYTLLCKRNSCVGTIALNATMAPFNHIVQLLSFLPVVFISLALSIELVHAQWFSPASTGDSASAFVEGRAFYIQGGSTQQSTTN